MGDQPTFSITHGPAKWAMVAVLGCAGVGGLAWAMIARTPANPTQVLAPPAAAVATPLQPVTPIAPLTGEQPADSAVPVLVARPSTNPVPESPANVPSALTEPKVVERTKLGPLPYEGEVPASGEPALADPAPPTQSTLPAATPAPATTPPSNSPSAAPLVTPIKININTASKAELELLPGIGPALADRLIEARTKKKFASLEDLDKVRGIGPKMLEKLKPRIVFQDPPAPAPARRGR